MHSLPLQIYFLSAFFDRFAQIYFWFQSEEYVATSKAAPCHSIVKRKYFCLFFHRNYSWTPECVLIKVIFCFRLGTGNFDIN